MTNELEVREKNNFELCKKCQKSFNSDALNSLGLCEICSDMAVDYLKDFFFFFNHYLLGC